MHLVSPLYCWTIGDVVKRWGLLTFQVIFGPFAILAGVSSLAAGDVGEGIVTLLVGVTVTLWLAYTERRYAHARSGGDSGSPALAPQPATKYVAPSGAVIERKPRPESGNLGHMRHGEWVPPRPQARTLEAWGNPGQQVDVVGEQYRDVAIRKMMKSEPGFFANNGAEIFDDAVLVLDPNNPFSSSGKAVAVYVRGVHVGYLSDDSTSEWYSVLPQIEARGMSLSVMARTWAVDRGGRVYAAVRISPPPVDTISPANGLPTQPHVVLPRGRKRQLTRESEHMDALRHFVSPTGSSAVAVALRSVTDVRARSTKEVVQAEINGARVGVFSDQQSAALLPLVQFVEARGLLPIARGNVEGNQLNADVVIWAPVASEVEQTWLDALGPAIPRASEVIPGPDWDWDED